MSENKTGRFSHLRPPNVLVPFAGLLFLGLLDLVLLLFFLVSTGFNPPTFALTFLPSGIVSLLGAFGVWRRARWGYIIGIALGGLNLATAYGTGHGIEIYATPANTLEFIFTLLNFPIGFIIFLYSISGLRSVWRKVSVPKPVPTIPRSSILALIVIGVILGGLIVGLLSGATESRLLSNAGTSADITIVSGAGSQNNGLFFSPASFNAKVGQTVTWVNRDSADHTVTNTNSTVFFDSHNLPSGGTFKFTFTQVGTYPYVCSYHAWMQGKIIVTP